MKRNFPRFFIEILVNWFNKSFGMVRWKNEVSKCVKINSGVKQGGILSPFLFNIFVDDVIATLAKSKKGCFFNFMCVNAIMYADDLILLSISVSDLQHLVNLCVIEFKLIGLEINAKKSSCIRIGNRFTTKACPIILNGVEMPWKQELEYLGVCIVSAKRFTLNWQKNKHKFFRALNGIFCKVGTQSSVAVTSNLIESCCTPILMYASECINWNSSSLKIMDNAYNQIYHKIFKSFDNNVIASCQFFLGQLPFELKMICRKFNFMQKLKKSDNCTIRFLCHGDMDNSGLCDKFKISDDSNSVHEAVWDYFKERVFM